MDGFFVLINISKFQITIPKDYSLVFAIAIWLLVIPTT